MERLMMYEECGNIIAYQYQFNIIAFGPIPIHTSSFLWINPSELPFAGETMAALIRVFLEMGEPPKSIVDVLAATIDNFGGLLYIVIYSCIMLYSNKRCKYGCPMLRNTEPLIEASYFVGCPPFQNPGFWLTNVRNPRGHSPVVIPRVGVAVILPI